MTRGHMQTTVGLRTGLYGSGPLNYQVAMYISLIAEELESKLSLPPPPLLSTNKRKRKMKLVVVWPRISMKVSNFEIQK